MIFAHVLEAKANGGIKYILVFRDFCEFYSSQEREELSPHIRWTFKEPSGMRILLNSQIALWMKDKDISVDGINFASRYFQLDTDSYIQQLKTRIEQMASFLQVQKDTIDEINNTAKQESDQIDEEHCKVHEHVDELEKLIQCAQQNGCKHIDAAIAEIRFGGLHGH